MKLSTKVLNSMNAVANYDLTFEAKMAEVERLQVAYQKALELENKEALEWYNTTFNDVVTTDIKPEVTNDEVQKHSKQNLHINQIVLVDGHLAVVKKVYDNYVEVNISCDNKVISNMVEVSKVKTVEVKAKYSKEEQKKMFGRVFSTGFISIMFRHLDFENVWGLTGDAIRIMSAKKVDMVSLEA